MTDITKLTQKDLIDIVRLSEFYGYMNADIEARFKAIADTIGEVPATIGEGDDEQPVINVIDFIQKTIALVNKDATALTKRVEANENEVQTLLPAYINAAAAAAVVKILGEDYTGDYKTLAKVEEWITAHKLTAKGMKDAIAALQGKATDDKTVASIPGVKAYIDSIVSDKNVLVDVKEGELLFTIGIDENDANKIIVGTTAKLQSAVTRAENSVQSIAEGASNKTLMVFSVGAKGTDGTVKMYTDDDKVAEALDAMQAAIQGDTDETIETIDAKAESIKIATSNQVRAIFGLDPIAE